MGMAALVSIKDFLYIQNITPCGVVTIGCRAKRSSKPRGVKQP